MNMNQRQLQQGEPERGSQHHDFEAQKQGHQRIRNDPDYDDWTYGTEPLPKEGWSPKRGNQQDAERSND
ncbi:MAG: hypothetical protein TE42_10025 [Candidatus Synechococcus spongiarum SP3]|uniref:Uncharacterized protein n=1 Tax=Candidatus Synechococcus spongiarum SP3 TaxID=1604020 RepID=A0A0G2J413_9SYNE|nr:MAG: hypothetical protein TE42_10025 [Candidatus Synechococcus spongiarum SP3]